jgi:hypothetical protein
MNERVSEDLAARGIASDEQVTLADDLLWGFKPISEEINRSERQTFHLIENGRLPAKKIGGRWWRHVLGCDGTLPASCRARWPDVVADTRNPALRPRAGLRSEGAQRQISASKTRNATRAQSLFPAGTQDLTQPGPPGQVFENRLEAAPSLDVVSSTSTPS